MSKKLAVVAIGGNSLITDSKHISVNDQYKAACETCKHIVELIDRDYKVVITHGNGPQVGFMLRRSEIASHELHMVPLDSCVADTQGAIGYQIQRAIYNVFSSQSRPPIPVATVITQTLVDKEDQSFTNPTKPIGSFMDRETAFAYQARDKWNIMEDAGRGWRRVVPSPKPQKILEIDTIKKMVESDITVVSVGGGGIPVIEKDGELWGAEAVIDKDSATAILATELNADLFIISTAVDKVFLNYGKEDQIALDVLNVADAEKYLHEGHFAPGSMLPKIIACIDFVKATGNKALITSPSQLALAVDGHNGTFIEA